MKKKRHSSWSPEKAKEQRKRYANDPFYRESQRKWARNYYWRKRNLECVIPIREKILERDDYRCGLCQGRKGKLTLHHIDGNKNNNNFDNLIILCWSCHQAIHILKKLSLTDSTKTKLLRLISF